MEYREFIERIKKEIEIRTGADARVRVSQVMKNNRMPMDSLAILEKGQNTAPAVYLEPFYRMHQQGADMETIVGKILEYHQKNKVTARIDADFLADFERVKHHIVCRLVSCEKNRYLLKHVPHRHFMDLVIIFYFELENPAFGKGNVQIQNAHLKLWGISADELYEAAMKNETAVAACEFMSISDMFEAMTGIAVEEDMTDLLPMYVLTNKERDFGAASLIFPHVLETVAGKLNGDYYVLPSSVHECMILPVPDGCGMNEKELRRMVCEINRDHVSEDEILGDSVYRYFAKEHELRIIESGDSKPD